MDSRFFFVVFLTLISTLTTSGAAQAQEDRFYIDLQKFPLYVKADFNHSDTVSPDLQDGSWLVREQWASTIIRRLDLPGLPKRVFLSPWGRPEQNSVVRFPLQLIRV